MKLKDAYGKHPLINTKVSIRVINTDKLSGLWHYHGTITKFCSDFIWLTESKDTVLENKVILDRRTISAIEELEE